MESGKARGRARGARAAPRVPHLAGGVETERALSGMAWLSQGPALPGLWGEARTGLPLHLGDGEVREDVFTQLELEGGALSIGDFL